MRGVLNAGELDDELEHLLPFPEEEEEGDGAPREEEREARQPDELLSGKVRRILERHASRPSSGEDALGLEDALEDIAEVHALIDDAMRRECSPLYRAFAGVRDTLSGLLGKDIPSYAADELFERQLSNLQRLNARLSAHTGAADRALDSLNAYLGETRSSLANECRDYRAVQEALAGKVEEISRQGAADASAREIRALLSSRTLLGQSILFRSRETSLLGQYEEMLSSAAHFSRLVGQNVSLVVRHVEQTRSLYRSFGERILAVEHLMGATELLGDYLGQLNQSVTEGALFLGERASEAYHAGAFPSLLGEALEQGVGRVRDTEFRHHEEIERLVEEVLGREEKTE